MEINGRVTSARLVFDDLKILAAALAATADQDAERVDPVHSGGAPAAAPFWARPLGANAARAQKN